MHLPTVQLGTRGRCISSHTELYHTHRVIVGVYRVLVAHKMAVFAVTVTTKEIYLWVVVACIRRAERTGIVTSSCYSPAQLYVAVGIDRKLGVINSREGKREP